MDQAADRDDDLKAKMAKNEKIIAALESGGIQLGGAGGGRNEAMIIDLKRENASYRAVLDLREGTRFEGDVPASFAEVGVRSRPPDASADE